ncbi:MAG: hypothetical protein OXI59_19625 [Gemmatimonadota bacterium]|nr:hypothetical protein [Gemmatimonadota bacterium]
METTHAEQPEERIQAQDDDDRGPYGDHQEMQKPGKQLDHVADLLIESQGREVLNLCCFSCFMSFAASCLRMNS